MGCNWVVIMKVVCLKLNANLARLHLLLQSLSGGRLTLIAGAIAALVFSSLFTVRSIYAQNVPTLGGVAVNIEINDTDVLAGDIISVTKDGFKRSTEEYDILMFGVVASAPILSVEPRGDNTRAVVSSGETQVRVSAANGNIEEGDLVTSSTTAGVGQKATKGGYVIGKSLQSYNGQEPGFVSVLIGPSFGGGSNLSTAAGSLVDLVVNPDNARLLFALILAVVILIGAAAATIRLVTSGVTAVGRNPLARATIYRSMAISAVAIIVILILGIGLVVAIIRLGG